MTELPRFISPAELAEMFKVPLATVYRWRYTGEGPPGARVGRHVRYRLDHALAWAEQEGESGATPQRRLRAVK